MYNEELKTVSKSAAKKVKLLDESISKYTLASIFGGLYVTLATMLSYTLGAMFKDAHIPTYKLAMGLSFGIALCLIVFAGAELYTSNNLAMVVGVREKTITWKSALKIWTFCWIGNLIGSVITAWLLVRSGLVNESLGNFVVNFTEIKSSLPIDQMLIRGIFCNILVCAGSWCTYRMKNEVGQLLMLAWCVLAFFTAGYEHSIANMGLFSMALMVPQGAALSIGSIITNLVVVTIGNTIGGAVVVGGAYCFISSKKEK